MAAKKVAVPAKKKIVRGGFRFLPQKNWASHQLALRIIKMLNDEYALNLGEVPVTKVAQAIRDYRAEERKFN